MRIRKATPADAEAVWAILEPMIRAGQTYPFPRDMSRDEAIAYWLGPSHTVYLAHENPDGPTLGTYYLKPNQMGGGAHVANCGYVVAPEARGKGLARQMCAHSLETARAAGYEAMQFNFVVSINAPAVHLWQAMGFAIVGRVPEAFVHPVKGRVDTLVMHRKL